MTGLMSTMLFVATTVRVFFIFNFRVLLCLYHLVTNLVIASMVLCFLRNPYWLLHKISFCVRKENTFVCTTSSNTLESVGRNDMSVVRKITFGLSLIHEYYFG